jgi:hypothetical protein
MFPMPLYDMIKNKRVANVKYPRMGNAKEDYITK